MTQNISNVLQRLSYDSIGEAVENVAGSLEVFFGYAMIGKMMSVFALVMTSTEKSLENLADKKVLNILAKIFR